MLRRVMLSAANTTTAAAASLAPIYQWGATTDGSYHRQVSSFRNHISRSPEAQFPAEADRYHLYVSWACPWAHRTLIVRALKNLEPLISISYVHYHMDEMGWRFAPPEECPGATLDTVNGLPRLRDIYHLAEPTYSDRFTVPVLWDKKLKTIVNNESMEIIRMFNEEFDHLLPEAVRGVTYYPEALRAEIDATNTWVYDDINNGVYKAGFATKQAAYETAAIRVFSGLDRVERILAENEYLVGGVFTEADIRLFTTIVRFDPVYHGHFKCNQRNITSGYPNILRWLRQVYQTPKVADTVNMFHIKHHYYVSHKNINPFGIVPIGNGPDLTVPYNRSA